MKNERKKHFTASFNFIFNFFTFFMILINNELKRNKIVVTLFRVIIHTNIRGEGEQSTSWSGTRSRLWSSQLSARIQLPLTFPLPPLSSSFRGKKCVLFWSQDYLIATSFLFIFLMINKTNKNRLWKDIYFSPSPKDTFFLHVLNCAFRKYKKNFYFAIKDFLCFLNVRIFVVPEADLNESASRIHWCIIFRQPLIKFQYVLSLYFIDIIS